MCATSSPLATEVALAILRHGGNAVDAAVTASAVLCITEPHMTGIGGDCFVLIGKPDGEVIGLNGSGRAGQSANPQWFHDNGFDEMPDQGPLSVTVPGAIDAWAVLLRDYGTMGLAQVLEPAIMLAEDGFPVTERVGHDWAQLVGKLRSDKGAAQHYLSDNKAPRIGQLVRQPALARTLTLIAEQGRDVFYEGEIAADIVSHLNSLGGILTMEDFARTACTYVTPIATSFQGHELLEIPPNGQGITALIMLNILSQFDMAAYPADSPDRFHVQVEAARLAYELRGRHVADPEFVHVPVDELLSDKTAADLAGLISMDKAIADERACIPAKGSDTIYLSVVDENRLAVSFINSIYSSFGSGVVTPKTGISLQNRGAGFVIDPQHPNCIAPGKRPFHTIIPGMLRRNGRIAMPFGVMGAAYQPMGHVQVLLNMLIYGMNIQQALDFPRMFYTAGVPESSHRSQAPGYHGTLGVEDGIPDAVVDELKARGHVVARLEEPLGGGQGIFIDWENGVLVGGSDPRKDGVALGY